MKRLRQFLSPLSNHRHDEYGGSLENRIRLPVQIIESVRRAVGGDFTVGIRLCVDEKFWGAIAMDESREFAQRFEDTGQIDFIDENGGHHAAAPVELLADKGKKANMVTSDLFIGIELAPIGDLYLSRQRLAKKGITFTLDIAVLEIQGRLVKGLNGYSNEMIDFQGYDTVVLAVGDGAKGELYFALKGKVKELYRIGDCVAPRKTDMAILEGHRVGRLL